MTLGLPDLTSIRGQLTIGGINLNTHAWHVLNLSLLWGPAATRGANATLPRTAGRVALPRYVDETSYSLPFVVLGSCDQSGNASTGGPIEGLIANLDYLWTNLFAPPSAPTATRSATLTIPGSSSRTAEVQLSVDPIEMSGEVARTVIELIVPAGRFA